MEGGPPPLSEEALNFLPEFEYFTRASRVLDEEDKPCMRRMGAVIKYVMNDSEQKVVAANISRPLLRCYQNDGTTERTAKRTSAKLPGLPTIHRRGRATAETSRCQMQQPTLQQCVNGWQGQYLTAASKQGQ